MLSCELTDRSLNIKRGVFFKKEKNIPLDKITDITLKQGPVMRKMGLFRLVVETAGQSQNGDAEGSLLGIIDPRAFRQKVLTERDKFTQEKTQGGEQQGGNSLEEIHAALIRIEKILSEKL